MTRKLTCLIEEYGEGSSREKRKRLSKLRIRLLPSADKRAKFSEQARPELAEAWELVAGSVVGEAIRLRDELRAILDESKTRADASRPQPPHCHLIVIIYALRSPSSGTVVAPPSSLVG